MLSDFKPIYGRLVGPQRRSGCCAVGKSITVAHAVALLVEELSYRPKGRGFDS
jgi:hypothetical protein